MRCVEEHIPFEVNLVKVFGRGGQEGINLQLGANDTEKERSEDRSICEK